MQNNARSMMKMGAIGALAGVMMIPVMNSKSRKKAARSVRNAYFRAADFMQDVKEMGRK